MEAKPYSPVTIMNWRCLAVTETEHPRFTPRVMKSNGEGQKHNSLPQDRARPTKPSQETL